MTAISSDATGPGLHHYLERVWTARGLSEHAWCSEVGVSQSTVNRLRRGAPATFELCRRIADAAGLPVVDLLLAAKLLSPDEVGYRPVEPVPVPQPPNLLVAIQEDSALTSEQREAFLAVYGAVFREDSDGSVPRVRTRKRR